MEPGPRVRNAQSRGTTPGVAGRCRRCRAGPGSGARCVRYPALQLRGIILLSSLRHPDHLDADELRLELRVPLLEKHLDDVAEVSLQLVEAGPQAVGSRPAGHAPDVQTGVGIPLNHDIEGAHLTSLTDETSGSARPR